MPSPMPYTDDDRPGRGWPRVYGDLSGLRAVPTVSLRHRRPSEASLRIMHQKLIIAACHDAHLSARIVAESLGLSDRHVRRIYRQKANAETRRKA